jgi:hypothetical protein
MASGPRGAGTWPGNYLLIGKKVTNFSVMKSLFTLALTVVSMAAFATSAFAGSCGGCPDGEKKDGAKTEEGAQS